MWQNGDWKKYKVREEDRRKKKKRTLMGFFVVLYEDEWMTILNQIA